MCAYCVRDMVKHLECGIVAIGVLRLSDQQPMLVNRYHQLHILLENATQGCYELSGLLIRATSLESYLLGPYYYSNAAEYTLHGYTYIMYSVYICSPHYRENVIPILYVHCMHS